MKSPKKPAKQTPDPNDHQPKKGSKRAAGRSKRQKTAEQPAKSTQATVSQRVNEILGIRLAGAEFPDIVQYASVQGWKVGERQLWNYIAKSEELLAQTLERDRTKLLNRHIAQRRALFARCMAVSDYSNARQVLKDEAELLNLYPAKYLAVRVTELEELIAELRATKEAPAHAPQPNQGAAAGRPAAVA